MSFPVSPTNGQQAVVNNITYQYDAGRHAWVRVISTANILLVNNLSVTNNVSAGAYYWSNGAPFVSSLYGDSNVAAYLLGNVTTGNISAEGFYFANGTPFISGSGVGTYGNVDVEAYLPTYTGNLNPDNITATGNIIGGGVRNSAGSTPPANPFPGDTWYDTDNDVILRYIDDGDSTQWIDISGIIVGDDSKFANATIANYLPHHSGVISAGSYFWANGDPFVSSTYSNVNVEAYFGANISSLQSNITAANVEINSLRSNITSANVEIDSLRSNITAANVEISSLRANIIATNAAIITANSGMKSYVDSQVISSGGYSNVSMTSYLATNDITVANITGGGVRTTSSASAPASPSVGDIWFSTTEDRIYRYTSDGTTKAWLDITGATYTFDMTGEMAITGNIIPTANVTYNLGSNDYRFKDLYLSGNTIYLGNATLTANSISSSSTEARYKATMMAMVFGA